MDDIFNLNSGKDKSKPQGNNPKKNKNKKSYSENFDQKPNSKQQSGPNKKQKGHESQQPAPSKKQKHHESQQLAHNIKQEESSDEDDEDIPDNLPPVDPNTYWNPFFQSFTLWMEENKDINQKLFSPSTPEALRIELVNSLPSIANYKYSWAIPNQQALHILAEYSPIVEVCAGKGYWGYTLKKYIQLSGKENIKPESAYVGYDINPSLTAEELQALKKSNHNLYEKTLKKQKFPAWSKIKKSSPAILTQYPKHTLFLCYPDEFEHDDHSTALDCLKHFKGSHVVLAGEALGQTLCENPWGKSADSSFQMQLAADFHKILQIPLPSWPGSIDSLTVWKRSIVCQVEDDLTFKYIPPKELLDLTQASPLTKHLLNVSLIDEKAKKS